MRRALSVPFVAVALIAGAASVAMADTVSFTRNLLHPAFPYNTTLNWGLLGANTVVSSGTSVTQAGLTTTLSFSHGEALTFVQCPATACFWPGTFSPGQIILDNTGGTTVLSFSRPIFSFGFQANPDGPGIVYIQIATYDGSTLLAEFSSGLFGAPAGGDNNTAGFYGIDDLTGADITSVKLLAYACPAPADCFADSLAINHPLIGTTPEPASLALLGSGLGMLGFLRRKPAVRK